MELKKGIPVSPGIVIGQAFVLDTEEIRIPQRFVEQDGVSAEVDRFEAALRQARTSLTDEIEQIGEKIGVGSQILEIHLQLLSDPVLINEVGIGIRDNQYTAEHAVSRVLNRYIKRFEGMDSPIIRERIHDLYDVERLILITLLGGRVEHLGNLEEEVILIAHNITPAQTATLDPEKVIGFATDVGGKTSHTAIMARALAIPAVVALENISTTVVGGDTVIIDGFRGVVMVNPEQRSLDHYRAKSADIERAGRRLRKQISLPVETVDGYRIDLQANIELPQEVHTAVDMGASGIGLFRTEFIHLQMPRPDEELHYAQYRNMLRELGGRRLTIRTLDLGGDKFSPNHALSEENPFLGCRSLRYCFTHPAVFMAQLRAIFRASSLGRVRLMLPMVGSIGEIESALMFIDQVKDDLKSDGVAFDPDVPVGIMVEVPSASLIADLLASRVDFFSVGTNDLVQYTLAVDRGNEQVAHLYDPVHPAVLRLIVRTIEAGHSAGIPVSLCGEMGSEPLYIPLLIGLGLRSLSVGPHRIPEAKQVIRSIQVHDAKYLARKCLALKDGESVAEELNAWARDNLPEIGYAV